MTTYRVQPTAQAQADVDSIFDWLAERSPDGARRWYEAFWGAAERLKTIPMSCPLAPEADEPAPREAAFVHEADEMAGMAWI